MLLINYKIQHNINIFNYQINCDIIININIVCEIEPILDELSYKVELDCIRKIVKNTIYSINYSKYIITYTKR